MSKKKKSYVGYWLRTKGKNGRIRLLKYGTGDYFWEFPWLWKINKDCFHSKFKKVRITLEEI